MDAAVKLKSYSYKGIRLYYREGTEDEKVLGHSFDQDIFFREIPSFRPSRRPVIIDVGAHIGTFSLLCAIKYPQAVIYAYEPCFETFRVLEENQKMNGLQRMQISHKAVSGVKGRVKLYHSEENGNWGHSISKVLSTSFEEVTATTLEQIITDNRIELIDLAKFNCEGAEFDILFNTPPHLIRRIGLGIILYHEDLDAKSGSVERLADLFKKLNFRVVAIRTGEKRGWLIVWNKQKYSWIYFILKALIRRLKG